MINEALYQALVQRFGKVGVSNQGQRRKAVRAAGDKYETVLNPGESYNVCCPFCGDTRNRLSISHAWLAQGVDGRARTDLINCYNEGCRELYSEDFYGAFVKAVQEGAKLQRYAAVLAPPEAPKEPMRLPNGCVSILDLPHDHIGIEFLKRKYPHTPVKVFGEKYGVLWTETPDERFRLAPYRLIFPIMEKGVLVSWQGRTVNSAERVRWFLPPGFSKPVYNVESVGADKIPVIAEGITSAIGCGDEGVCIFGKSIAHHQVKAIAAKYETCVLALDPETYVMDYTNKKAVIAVKIAKELLDAHLKRPAILLEWPEEALEKARIKVGQDKEKRGTVSVPDPADYGPEFMSELISTAKRKALHG